MNNYSVLTLSLLATVLMLTILTFQFGELDQPRQLILTYEVGMKFSLEHFRILLVGYFLTLSGLSFWAGNRTDLTVHFLWFYISLLVLPWVIFTFTIMIPQLIFFLFFSEVGEPGSYYNNINNYGLFNIWLISLNVTGLFMFGLRMVKILKSMANY